MELYNGLDNKYDKDINFDPHNAVTSTSMEAYFLGVGALQSMGKTSLPPSKNSLLWQ